MLSAAVVTTWEWRLTENTTWLSLGALALSMHPEAVAYRESQVDLAIQAPRCGLPYDMLRTAASISDEAQRKAVRNAIHGRVRTYVSQLRNAGVNGIVQTVDGPIAVDRAGEQVMHARDEVLRYLKAAWYGAPKSEIRLQIEQDSEAAFKQNKIVLFCEIAHSEEFKSASDEVIAYHAKRLEDTVRTQDDIDVIIKTGKKALNEKLFAFVGHIEEAFGRRDWNIEAALARVVDSREAIFPQNNYYYSSRLATLLALWELPRIFYSLWKDVGSPLEEALRSVYFDCLIKAYIALWFEVGDSEEERQELWRYFCERLMDSSNTWDISQEFFLFMTGRSTEVTRIHSAVRKGPINEGNASEWGDSRHYGEQSRFRA